MVVSNGDVVRVRRLVRGEGLKLIDIDGIDVEGILFFVYVSCFGYKDVVQIFLDVGVIVDNQDCN